MTCPELVLAQKLFLLRTPDLAVDKAALQAELLQDVFAHGASPQPPCRPLPHAARAFLLDRAPLYVHLCETLGWEADTAKLEAMRSRNDATLCALRERCVALRVAHPCGSRHCRCAARQSGGRNRQPGRVGGSRGVAGQGCLLREHRRQGEPLQRSLAPCHS